jgi:hypothetical protein
MRLSCSGGTDRAIAKICKRIPAPFSEGQASGARQWGEAVAVDDDGNIYMGMNGAKGVERYARR